MKNGSRHKLKNQCLTKLNENEFAIYPNSWSTMKMTKNILEITYISNLTAWISALEQKEETKRSTQQEIIKSGAVINIKEIKIQKI